MKRRSLLIQGATAATALGGSPLLPAAAPAPRPNVVLIVADELAYQDISLLGGSLVPTPHLDTLVSEGLRFTNFHGAPIGAATRGQLLSGRDALFNRACCDSAGRNRLRRDLPTVADLFRQDGYITAMFGLWQLGHNYPDRPIDRGFDRALWYRGPSLQSALEFDNDYHAPRYLNGAETKFATAYCTDLWFESAVSWMERQYDGGQPFLCYLSTESAPGAEQAPRAAYARYRERVDASAATHCATLDKLDENLGRLERWLRDSGAWANTIVILLGAAGRSGQLRSADSPWRGSRNSHYEGGHRAPCILRWPEAWFEAGAEIDTPVQAQDLLPTLLDFCEVPAGHNAFDGLSLAPLAIGGEIEDRKLIVQYGLREAPRKYDAAVLWRNWRLQNGTELYDLDADPAQEHDIASRNGNILGALREHYEQWWEQLAPDLNKPLPAFIGTGRENPEYLSCIEWWQLDVDSLFDVAAGQGGARGGSWNIQIFTAGTYDIELRRWPFHGNNPIDSEGPRETLGGLPLDHRVRRIDAREAVLALNGSEQTLKFPSGARGVNFRVELLRGKSTLQGWFRDAAGQDLAGAYYARLRRLSDPAGPGP